MGYTGIKKSTLIKLHLYCGLFTSFYLLALGFSTLVLNHGIQLEKDAVTDSWTGEVSVDSSLTDVDLAHAARDQLGIMGWVPGWRTYREAGKLHFQVTHMGKTSELALDLATGTTRVDVKPKGLLAAIHGLHFFNGRIPNAPFFLTTWIVYQYLALLVLFLSLGLGLWLWIQYSHRTWELYIFGGIFLVSILLMASL